MSTTAREEALFQANDLYNQALALYDQGKVDEAREMALQALAKAEGGLGPNDSDIVTYIAYLGFLDCMREEFDSSDALYKRCLAIASQGKTKGKWLNARTLLDLGYAFDRRQLHRETYDYVSRAADMLETLFADEASEESDLVIPALAEATQFLGDLCLRAVKFEEAEKAYARSIEVAEALGEQGYEHTATALTSLARLYKDKMEYALADATFRRAHVLLERSLGVWDPRVASLCEELANLHELLGNPSKARELLKKALTVYKQAGKDSRSYILGLDHMAANYDLDENLSEAIKYAEQAVELAEKHLPEGDSELANLVNRLANLYRQNGNLEQADKFDDRVKDLISKSYD